MKKDIRRDLFMQGYDSLLESLKQDVERQLLATADQLLTEAEERVARAKLLRLFAEKVGSLSLEELERIKDDIFAGLEAEVEKILENPN